MNLQAALHPLNTDVGSLPGVVPLYSSQVSLTLFAHVALSIVAVSPKLELMPTSSLPLDALTFLMTTLRLALYQVDIKSKVELVLGKGMLLTRY